MTVSIILQWDFNITYATKHEANRVRKIHPNVCHDDIDSILRCWKLSSIFFSSSLRNRALHGDQCQLCGGLDQGQQSARGHQPVNVQGWGQSPRFNRQEPASWCLSYSRVNDMTSSSEV